MRCCDYRRPAPTLTTRDEWLKMPPQQQGYTLYVESSWPGSELAGITNPYKVGTKAHGEFRHGEYLATLMAQDSEE